MAERVRAAEFAAFLKERWAAGDGYILGASGQDPRQLSPWYFSGQYRGELLESALHWKACAPRVWDGNGLAEGYYRERTGMCIGARISDNYGRWCDPRGGGEIPPCRRTPGAAVFRRSAEGIFRVGFLAEAVEPGAPGGDWYVIGAKSVRCGVTRERLLGGGWNLWGWMTRYFDYGAAGGEEANCVPGARLLRQGMRGADVAQLQRWMLALGWELRGHGADGVFGAETEAALRSLQAALDVRADGCYDGATHAALMALLELNGPGCAGAPLRAGGRPPHVRVAEDAWLRLEPDAGAPLLTAAQAGTELECVAAAWNGWRCVRAGGLLGWVPGELCTDAAEG